MNCSTSTIVRCRTIGPNDLPIFSEWFEGNASRAHWTAVDNSTKTGDNLVVSVVFRMCVHLGCFANTVYRIDTSKKIKIQGNHILSISSAPICTRHKLMFSIRHSSSFYLLRQSDNKEWEKWPSSKVGIGGTRTRTCQPHGGYRLITPGMDNSGKGHVGPVPILLFKIRSQLYSKLTSRPTKQNLVRQTGGGRTDRVAAFVREGRGFESSQCRSTSYLTVLCWLRPPS